MDIVAIILDAMDELLGLDKSEMAEMLDVNLLQEGLIDSLSVVTLLSAIEDEVGHPIDIRKMSPDDLSSVNKLAQAVLRQF